MVINNLLFIFIIKTILNTESECPIIECDDIKNENDTCLIYNPKESNKVFISPCKDNYYCPLQSDEFEEGTLKLITISTIKYCIFLFTKLTCYKMFFWFFFLFYR